jgi:hypothetical protein
VIFGVLKVLILEGMLEKVLIVSQRKAFCTANLPIREIRRVHGGSQSHAEVRELRRRKLTGHSA